MRVEVDLVFEVRWLHDGTAWRTGRFATMGAAARYILEKKDALPDQAEVAITGGGPVVAVFDRSIGAVLLDIHGQVLMTEDA